MKTHPSIHPGEVLREDFLIPLGLWEYRLAKESLKATRQEFIHASRYE